MRPQKTPRKVAEYKAARAVAHKEGLLFRTVDPQPVICCTDASRALSRKSGKCKTRGKGNYRQVDEDKARTTSSRADVDFPVKEEVVQRDSIITVPILDIARAARPVKAKGVAKEFVILSPPNRVIALEDDSFDPGPSIFEDDWEKI